MSAKKPIEGSAEAALKSQINENLKRVYSEALAEDIPDRFKELLERLKASETTK